MTSTSNRPTDLHHQIPVQRMQWSDIPIAPPVRVAREHPPGLLRSAAAIAGTVHVGTLVFWMFYASHDPFRRVFIEVLGAKTWALVAAAVVTLAGQSVLSITIARHVLKNRRIPIANSLRAVVAWGVVGFLVVGWTLFGDGATPWLGVVGAALVLAARLLFVTVKRAVIFDG